MARSVGIMAYGTPDDRLRLEALAKLERKSSSQWLVEMIRRRYAEVYGSASPASVVLPTVVKE